MIWIIIAGLIAAAVLWIVGNLIVSWFRLRRYKKMLATITHEEVQKRSKKFKWTKKEMKAGVQPPAMRAWEELFAERKKEWGYE